MKKILMLIICCLLLVGCESHDSHNDENNSQRQYREIMGHPVKVNLNKDGNIVIDEESITDQVIYYTYEYEGVAIGLLAVRNSKGKVIVVINTCRSCGGSPYAYFVQVGNQIQCQNCGNYFAIDNLDNLEPDGCNPIEIEDITNKNGKIIIGTKQLNRLKDKFENWNGPKV